MDIFLSATIFVKKIFGIFILTVDECTEVAHSRMAAIIDKKQKDITPVNRSGGGVWTLMA